MIVPQSVVLIGTKAIELTGVTPVASPNICHFALIALMMETMLVMTINFIKVNQVGHVIVENRQ